MENAATLIISIIILVILIIIIVIIICCKGGNNNQNKNNFCTFFQGNSAQCCGVPNEQGKSCHFTSKTDNGYVDVSYNGICVNNHCTDNW
jgi:hypothetical protein